MIEDQTNFINALHKVDEMMYQMKLEKKQKSNGEISNEI